jgi:hypothetical protein
MKTVKSDDYMVRSALVAHLMATGVHRASIRHEITLDTSSSGGRADVVVLHDGCISGLELKSARDTLDRCKQQIRAYEMAFDLSILVVDEKYGPRDANGFWNHERAGKLWHNFFVYKDGEIGDWFSGAFEGIQSSRFSTSRYLSAQRMLSLLWASEIKSTFGASLRHKGIKAAAEAIAIREIRHGVVSALRSRQLNRWEEAFWRRYDANRASRSRSPHDALDLISRPHQQLSQQHQCDGNRV